MALLFDDTASDKLQATSTFGYSSPPVTFSVWIRSDETGVFNCPFHFGNETDNDGYRALTVTGDNIQIQRVAGAASKSATSSNAFTINVWSHLVARFDISATTVWLDGTKTVGTSGIVTPAGIAQMSIGVQDRGGVGDNVHWSGDLAEFAMWNASLDDDEIASLAAGLSAANVRPDALGVYEPLIRPVSGGPFWRGDTAFTTTGTAVSAHPRIFYPNSPHVGKAVSTPPVVATAGDANATASVVDATTLQGIIATALDANATASVVDAGSFSGITATPSVATASATVVDVDLIYNLRAVPSVADAAATVVDANFLISPWRTYWQNANTLLN